MQDRGARLFKLHCARAMAPVLAVHAARLSGGLANLPALPTGVKFSGEKQ